MTLDPYVKAFVDQMIAANMPPDFAVIGPQAAKEASAATAAMLGHGPDVMREADVAVAGADGPLRARLYVPEGKLGGLLVYLHGGGWVVGDLAGYDSVLRRFANGSGCAILSVEYRLAPEFPFPTPVEDCYAALCWAAANKAALGLPADLPLLVGGDSAGGNLSAVMTLLARERGGPELTLQLLIYPATNADFTTASYRAFTENLPLTSRLMFWFWDQYIADPAQRANPLAAPLLAPDHSGLPPAVLVIAGYDPLRSEGDAYGEKLKAAGVPVKTMTWEGQIHGFFQFAEILPPCGQACDEIAGEVKAILAGAPVGG